MFEKQKTEKVLAELKVDKSTGLNSDEAANRLLESGRNEFEEKKQKSLFSMFVSQLRDPMIYILGAAVIISAFLGEWIDACIIIAIILLNAIIGVVQENKAEKSLEALKKLSSPTAIVRRGGKPVEIPAAELVPGDIVLLEAGRIIPADLRLIETVNMKVEESSLTGESVPVGKDADFVAAEDLGIGDRINMAYLSTSVAFGRGEGVVTATGMNTEIGKIARMINEAVNELTPLQKRLGDLGKLLGIICVFICAAMLLVAIIQGRDLQEMFLTAIALAVAAIPEGLPAVVTIVLALGVQRMVRVNTIVRKLPAVETLGSVSVVCSDKTGTLTQNVMTVTKVFTGSKLDDVNALNYEKDRLFLDGFILCNDAESDPDKDIRTGDPTELALLDVGTNLGFTRRTLEKDLPRINELSFDSERKMMTTVHKDRKDGEIISFTKGAMDRILKICDSIDIDGEVRPITADDIKRIEDVAREMTALALRVLALSYKKNDDTASEESLTFKGLVGMIDPPRPEAADAVKVFDGASVKTIMITGDHRDTAFAIAKELGIADDPNQCVSGTELDKMSQEELNTLVVDIRVFARVSPEHKVMIVKAFRSHGSIVSMTGDGVNDAPSLKAADIGVAMGITGTDVAKGASDMVLTDDNFATIEKAIEEGRNIYNNIKKSVLYLLSSNIGEVLTMFVAIAAGLLAPLRAIHLLWINLITDSLPALALGVDNGDPRIMKEPPRNPKDSLFAQGGIAILCVFGTLIGIITLFAFLYAPIKELISMGMSVSIANIDDLLDNNETLYRTAQTYAFTTLGISQLFNAWGFRNMKRSVFRFNPFSNRMMIIAFCVGLILQISITEVPFLIELFNTVSLSFVEWIELIILSTAPVWVHEIFVLIRLLNERK